MNFRTELQQLLAPPTQLLHEQLRQYAAVAIILRGTTHENLEVGYIRRAVHEADRWSGQIAFPGGKREDHDSDDVATALRETREEIGLELSRTEKIGQLNDIQARRAGALLDFFIRPLVFYREEDFNTTLAPDEVVDFFWVSLGHLLDTQKQTHYELNRNQVAMKLPAIQMPSDPPLWGLTLMMTQELLDKIKKP